MTAGNHNADWKTILPRARKMLGTSGNRVKLIVGLLLCILATVSILLTVSALSLLVDFDALYAASAVRGALVELALVMIQTALILLLGFPLYFGLYSVALDMRRGMPVCLSDLFVFFDSPAAYFRGMGIVFRVVGRAYPYLILYGLSTAAYLTENDVVYGVVGLAALPLVVWGLYTTGRIFPFLTFALCNPDVPLRHTMMNAKAMTHRKTLAIFVFRMQLLWRFLLSLASVGVVTLFHVLPLTILATHEYAFALARRQAADLD